MEDVKSGLSLFEKLENPILGILLFCLFSIIVFSLKMLKNKEKRIEDLQLSKDNEVKELNKILLEISKSDKEMLTELKNLMSRYIEVEKATADDLKRNNELLVQILAKIDYSLQK